MNQLIDIVIKQKPYRPKLIKHLSNGDIVKLHGGSIGLVCYGVVAVIADKNGVPSFDVLRKSELLDYTKRLGTLAGITVQED